MYLEVQAMSMKINKQISFAMFEANLKFAKDPMKLLFDKIDFSFIYPLVEPFYKSGGRSSFDPVSIFKALLFIYMDIKIQSERQLAKHLKHDMRILSVCGFEDFFKTPCHATFSIFRSTIGDETFFKIFHNLVSQSFALGIISGQITATDATHLWAYSNKFGKKLCTCKDKIHCKCPKTYSDPDASWGKKNKDYAFLGYKVHLIVDAKSQLPISVTVTKGNSHDSQEAVPLLNQLKKEHPDIKPKFNTADSGYDSHNIYKEHIDNDITPIIDLNEKRKTNPLITREIKIANGHPHCKRAKLAYWGFDPHRNRFKFRCPLACAKISSCKYSQKCFITPYGKTFYLHPTDNIRLFPEIPRFSEQWKLLYNNRTSVERTNSELKEQHTLKNIRFRTITKVKSHVYLSCISLLLKRCSDFFENPVKYRYAFSNA
jgi:transposase